MKNQKQKIKGLAVVALAAFSIGNLAHASQGRGGGHFVYNADGSVTIADQYYHNDTIVPTPISRSLKLAVEAKAGNLGAVGLSRLNGDLGSFMYLFDKTLYYFVDVIPQVADCDLKVSLTLPAGSTVDLAACTSGNHTFIKTSDWDAAQAPVKLDLLVHEALRQFSGPNTSVTEGEIMTIVQASDLIETIHNKEKAQKYENLTLKETQLLEAARAAVVDIVFQGKPPQSCESEHHAGGVNDHHCYADTLNYGVTPNGGGILRREYLSNIPDSAYIGVGSLLVGPGSVSENLRMERSAIFINYWIQENVTLKNVDIEGINTVVANSVIQNAMIYGLNNGLTIDDFGWYAQSSNNRTEMSGHFGGATGYAGCYLDVTGRTGLVHFNLPSDCTAEPVKP